MREKLGCFLVLTPSGDSKELKLKVTLTCAGLSNGRSGNFIQRCFPPPKYMYMRYLLSIAAVFVFAAAAFSQSESLAAGNAGDNYLILSTKRISTMEKELADAGSKGYRVLYGAPTNQVDMALFLQKG